MGNYRGYLVCFGNTNTGYKITGERYINLGSYDATREVQDMDSYRDATGVLHRNALSHIPYKIVMETLPNLSDTEVATLFNGIKANYTSAIERKASVTAWIPELGDYITQDMYMAGPTLKISAIDPKKNTIKYNSFKISLIGY